MTNLVTPTRKKWLLTVSDPILDRRIKKLLTFTEYNYYSKTTDIVRMFGKKGFKAGLIDYLNEALEKERLKEPEKGFPKVELKLDLEPLEPLYPMECKELSLYDYQIDGANSVINRGYGIIQSPTASGKTRMEMAIALKFPKPLLIVVPSKDLLYQIYNDFTSSYLKRRFSIGRYGAGRFKNTTSDIIVITGASIARGSVKVKALIKKSKSLIVDEVHHSTKKLYSIFGNSPILYRAGLSATPGALNWTKSKKLRLVSNFGKIVYKGSEDERTQKHRINPKVYTYHYNKKPPEEFKHDLFEAIVSHNFIKQKKYAIVRNDDRNRFILKIAELFRLRGKNVMITVNWTEHLDNLERLAKGVTDHIYFLEGTTNDYKRSSVYSKIEKDSEPIIVAGTVGGEGVDITYLDVVIMADTNKSSIKIIQAAGRTARSGEGKTEAILVDIKDTLFLKHFKDRMKAYKQEGYEIEDLLPLLKK